MKIKATTVITSVTLAILMAVTPATPANAKKTSVAVDLTSIMPPNTSTNTHRFATVSVANASSTDSSTDTTAQPQMIAECGIAVVVLAVGGYVIYKLVKLCKKVLPPTPPQSTNSPSTNSSSIYVYAAGTQNASTDTTADTNVYAAWFTINPVMTTSPDSSGCIVIPTGVTTNGQPWINAGTVPSASSFVAMTNFLATLQTQYGLVPGSYYGTPGTVAYGLNGQPVASLTNIIWDYSGGTGLTVTNGSPMVTAVLQRCTDLTGTNWIGICTNTIPKGYQISIEDETAPTHAGFYRVVVNE